MTTATSTGPREGALDLAWLHDPEARSGRVWAGEVSVDVGGLRFDGRLVRAYRAADPPVDAGSGNRPHAGSDPVARLRCELFVADIEPRQVQRGEVRARLRADPAAPGDAAPVPLRLLTDGAGRARPWGNNLVFESADIPLTQTGAFRWEVEFQAAGADDWVALTDLGDSPPTQVVVSPAWVADSPTVTEVCLRKVGARIEGGQVDGDGFVSGRIVDLTARLEQIPTDVVYLLPFFLTGTGDLHTGQDVRKGTLGSVYAVRDFFRLDPDLVTPPAAADLAALVADGLLTDADVADVWARVPAAPVAATDSGSAPTAAELAAEGGAAAARAHGEERLVQLLGQAQLRQLTRRAHELGKRVIFDLVLMQTSRDCPLIEAHPEWYALDEEGRPRIHQIAWFVYSDVALFDLKGNRPLQDYLLEVAPFWMERCELDGVRIDASQTVDRDFLRRLKNRIQGVDPEALILGETLCALREAVDIPVDMIYALMVDFHRDVQQATPLIDFLEEMHGTFAAGTVAMAYFENHDSPRATAIWAERYADALEEDRALARTWRRLLERDGTAGWMARLKNLQATLVDATAGMWPAPAAADGDRRPVPSGGTQLAWAIEWGSDWGEQQRTDFENETLLQPEQREVEPGARLVAAYRELAAALPGWPEVRRGQVWYHRNAGADGDAEDRVLAYTRYTGDSAVVVVHNLDVHRGRWVTVPLDWLPWSVASVRSLFDSYAALGLAAETVDPDSTKQGLRVGVRPLQTRLLRLTRGASLPRKD